MWSKQLKLLDISLHVIATGAGAGLQNSLSEVPGCSSYFSGASFPYSKQEQIDLLGFEPESFCSEEAAIDLASIAYMKAYQFGGKAPVGLGLTGSIASEQEHRGDHRIHVTVITNERAISFTKILVKGSGKIQRILDNSMATDIALYTLKTALNINEYHDSEQNLIRDIEKLAKERFFLHPFFTANGKRLTTIPCNKDWTPYALMSGAFNPPHEGHFQYADHMLEAEGKAVIFELTAEPPHKAHLSVQELLQRAKLLQGYNRIFTRNMAFYLDKAKAFPGMSLVMGADAALRMFDPKWGLEILSMLQQFQKLKCDLFIGNRMIDGKIITRADICKSLPCDQATIFTNISHPIQSEYHISSTKIRNQLEVK